MKQIHWQGHRISRIALGSTNFGEPMSREESWRVIDYAREQGVNVLDTARVYGEWYKNGGRCGYCEDVIGSYLEDRKCRNQVYLITKGGHPPLHQRHESRLNAKCLRDDLEASLLDLRTDHVDLYFLHRDHSSMDLPEVMEALNQFVKEGKVGAVGASNWRYDRIQEANRYAKEHGLTPFTASQMEWSMAKFEDCCNKDDTQLAIRPEEYEEYKKSGMLVMCFTAQAHGLFSRAQTLGGYDKLAEADALGKYKDPANRQRIEAALWLCRKYRVSPAALAVAYLTSQDFPVIPVLGCSRLEQMQDSLSATDLTLNAEDYYALLQNEIV